MARQRKVPQKLQIPWCFKKWAKMAGKKNGIYLHLITYRQVQVFSNYRKKFLGQIRSENLAARIYDKRAIMTNGLKAKTNFDYTKRQLRKLLQNDEDVHEADLSEDEGSSK